MSFRPPFSDPDDIIQLIKWGNDASITLIKKEKPLASISILKAVSNIIFWVSIIREDFLRLSINYPPPSRKILDDDDLSDETKIHYLVDDHLFSLLDCVRFNHFVQGEDEGSYSLVLKDIDFINDFFDVNKLSQDFDFIRRVELSATQKLERTYKLPR